MRLRVRTGVLLTIAPSLLGLASPTVGTAQDKTGRLPVLDDSARTKAPADDQALSVRLSDAYVRAVPELPPAVRFNTGGNIARHWWMPMEYRRQYDPVAQFYNPNGSRATVQFTCGGQPEYSKTIRVGPGEDARVNLTSNPAERPNACHFRADVPVALVVHARVRTEEEWISSQDGSEGPSRGNGTNLTVSWRQIPVYAMPDRP